MVTLQEKDRLRGPSAVPCGFRKSLHLGKVVTSNSLNEASSEGRLLIHFCVIASKQFIITEQWALQTEINFKMKRTFLVISYQNSSSQLVFAFSSHPGNEVSCFKSLELYLFSWLLWERRWRSVSCFRSSANQLLALRLKGSTESCNCMTGAISAMSARSRTEPPGALQEVCMK